MHCAKALDVYGTGEDVRTLMLLVHSHPVSTQLLRCPGRQAGTEAQTGNGSYFERVRDEGLRGKGEAARLEVENKIRLQLCCVLIALFNSSF